MKSHNIILPGVFVTACIVLHVINAMSQITTFSELQSNAEITAQMTRSNADAKAEYRRLHPTKEDLEWATAVAQSWKSSQPWTEASKKQETLKHCADFLRSAIDTNQIEKACISMTNQPKSVVSLKEISAEVISNLNMVATLLTNPDLTTSLGEAGYQAGIQNISNLFHFGFWSENRLPTSISDFDERTADAQHVILSARFYQNGKLLEYDNYSRDRQGIFRRRTQLIFNEDGTLRSYWMKSADAKP
jgi:hypothetical protein